MNCRVCGGRLVSSERTIETHTKRPGGGIRGPGGGHDSRLRGTVVVLVVSCITCGLMYDPKVVKVG